METAISASEKEAMRIIEKLKIEKLVYKGYGLGFNDSNPIFVPYSVPGDIADVEIEYQKKDVFFGKIKELIKRSPHRIEPDCEVFGKCGGCDWLNIPYEKQLEYKQLIINEIFRNVKVNKVNKILASSQQEYYRNKSFFPISEIQAQPVIGMFERKSHTVIQHKHCRLYPPIFVKIIVTFLSYMKAANVQVYNEQTGKGIARHLGIRYSKITGDILVVLVTKSRKLPFSKQLVRTLTEEFPEIVGIVQNINPARTNTILGNENKLLYGRDHIFEKIGKKRYKLHSSSFFQVNSGIAEQMYDFCRAHIKSNDKIIDAYCGVGSIGIFVADKAAEVIGIENNKFAVQDAVSNAKLDKVENCHFITGDVEQELPILCRKEKFDTIIFDPPRKGLDEHLIKKLPDNIRKIIYISCNPATQARDAKLLLEKGFKIILMQPFDMFPHTYHIENVLVLERI
jgi:23S rRNA (uracil1939-C5)-methyltransferase